MTNDGFFLRAPALLAGGACAGQPVILSLPSTSNVSMKGSFVNALGTPSNSIVVPGSALPGSAFSNFKVTSGVSGEEMPTTSSFGLSTGFCEISLPLNFVTPLAPPGRPAPLTEVSKYCSPLADVN